MTTVAQIRDAIQAVVAAVPDVGQVFAYERYVGSEAKFKALYLFDLAGGGQQLRGWWLRRTATREYSPNVARTINVHTWTLRGYMALNDDAATELAFDDLVEGIRDAVRADLTFGGLCQLGPLSDGEDTDGVQLVDTGPVSFCGVLCHSAVLTLRTWSYL